MPELIPCDICGGIPEMRRSYSRHLISHKCKDYSSGWDNRETVIAKWNDSNYQQSGSVKTSNNIDYTAALMEELMLIFIEVGCEDVTEELLNKIATRLNSAIKASQNCA